MVVCKFCKTEMTTSKGCISIPFRYTDHPDEKPILFGDEADVWYDEEQDTDTIRCGDCSTTLGNFHHTGCDVERCPRCNGQAISCECLKDEV